MFEHRAQALLPLNRFVRRMLKFLLIGMTIDALVVLVGAIGFHVTLGTTWLDAFIDGAMVVTGNGPRHAVTTASGKFFLMFYALTGCTIYIIVVALVLTPALHRLLHVLHLRAPQDPDSSERPAHRRTR